MRLYNKRLFRAFKGSTTILKGVELSSSKRETLFNDDIV